MYRLKKQHAINELSLRTFSVTNETDGSGGEEGLVLMFSGLSFSSCSSSSGLLFWNSLGRLGYIVIALIELSRMKKIFFHLNMLLRSKMSFHQALDFIFELDETTVGCTRDIVRQRDCLDRLCEVPWIVPTFVVIEGEREILLDVVGTSGCHFEVFQSFPVERIEQGNE
ncbi:hypothetical protein Tco_1387127 [Tanacetum coccineum]